MARCLSLTKMFSKVLVCMWVLGGAPQAQLHWHEMHARWQAWYRTLTRVFFCTILKVLKCSSPYIIILGSSKMSGALGGQLDICAQVYLSACNQGDVVVCVCSWRPPCSRQYRCWSEKPRGGKKEGSVIQLATGPWNCVILRAMELWLNTNRQSVFGIAKFSSILFCRLWGHGWTFIKYSASGYSVPGWRSKSLDHHSPWIQDLLHDQIWRKKCQTIGQCLCYLCSTFNRLSVSIVSSALWEPRVCYRHCTIPDSNPGCLMSATTNQDISSVWIYLEADTSKTSLGTSSR